mmetsp:Transcript_43/g.82  ORF Transcript_43/g.82 Transcript_43/m.82 type:complete len:187 (+) Transcript_43:1392-1952(+)|eukprot:CAMPEP_0178994618 /NCGR_PEP_ID=MMETSP0795-20121207/7370_1 /TAXON_ID=88552 /ORGANISM="Amoebophrya sp., Strain Ameob2" /LENGTH=186 /DNA_ID=CAMNT_0020686831 /DNA_START=1401 /DNA_END=1961 /DNA_ORIENTATION=-
MSFLTRFVRPTRAGVATAVAGSFAYGASSSSDMRRRPVFCEEGGSPFGGFDMAKLQGLVGKPDWVTPETMKPLTGGLTFGGASGLAAGYACKKIGKAVAVGVGSIYCLFQVAASYGYVTINWKKVEKDVMTALDTNGDGKVDEKDAGIWLQKVLDVLANDELEGAAAKNTATGAFAGTFLLGLRRG